MNVYIRALLTVVVVFGGAFLAVATNLDPNAKIADIGEVSWLVMLITGLVAGANDLKSMKQEPSAIPGAKKS